MSPIAGISNHVLMAKSDMTTFIDSLVAPMSVINALILAIGMKKRDRLNDKFKSLEVLWKASQTYSDK